LRSGRGEEEERGGTIGCGACSQLARVEVRGVVKQRERGGTEKEEREKRK